MSNQSKEKSSVILKITRAVRDSGFLAVHSSEEFQTLIALCAFADYEGKLRVSSKALAQVLNLSEKQAQLRIKNFVVFDGKESLWL